MGCKPVGMGGGVSETPALKAFTQHRARRFGYDGWALKHKQQGTTPLAWTVCTTRAEARQLLDEQRARGALLEFEIVKVKLRVEAVA